MFGFLPLEFLFPLTHIKDRFSTEFFFQKQEFGSILSVSLLLAGWMAGVDTVCRIVLQQKDYAQQSTTRTISFSQSQFKPPTLSEHRLQMLSDCEPCQQEAFSIRIDLLYFVFLIHEYNFFTRFCPLCILICYQVQASLLSSFLPSSLPSSDMD